MSLVTTNAERLLDGHYKTLVFVAHPDDESIASSFFLQRQRHSYVAFATSGGYTTPDRLHRVNLPSLSAYASKREEEALNALRLVPEPQGREFFRLSDFRLHHNLGECFEMLSDAAQRHKPDFLLTHAFEGGHGDHDCCSFIASRIRRRLGVNVWEMPTYHREGLRVVSQAFREGIDDTTVVATPSQSERDVKKAMLECHRTQTTLDVFGELGIDVAAPELYRPQREHDYQDKAVVSPALAASFEAFDATF